MAFNSLLSPYYENRYKSHSQLIRVASEKWAIQNLTCPACSSGLAPYPNNMKVSDFHCEDCNEKFQLKSSKHGFSKYVLDGEYRTQIESISRGDYQSLLLLSYQDRVGPSHGCALFLHIILNFRGKQRSVPGVIDYRELKELHHRLVIFFQVVQNLMKIY